MRQYSAISESKSHLMKIRQRYTPQEWERIRKKMLSLGKKNGGWYSPEEYGRRMIKGQVKRARNLNPNIKLQKVNNVFDAQAVLSSEPVVLGLPGRKSKITPPFTRENFKTAKEYKKAVRDWYRTFPSFKRNYSGLHALTSADVAAHEVDELSSAYKHAVKYGVFPTEIGDVMTRIHKDVNGFAGLHNPGVLKREAKRSRLLHTLYGRGSYVKVPRTQREYTLNNPSKRDLSGLINDWEYVPRDVW